MKIALLLQADSYKYSHYKLYPAGTTNNNSYIESRGIDPEIGLPPDTEVLFFGLQAFIKEYLLTPITMSDIDKAEALIPPHGLPFNRADWEIVVNQYDGFFPITIQAIPEGTPVNPRVALVQVRATDDRFAWLASFVETAILRAVWYPTTVATVSREAKKIILGYLRKTCENPEQEILFKLHDFGARGASSSESAQLGGLGHLVNFMGTDTVEALVAAMEYYKATGPVGYSVPASEHSTITAWGRDGELAAYDNMIEIFGKPGAIVSCVSDSYDIFNACENLWPSLKEKIEARGCTLVVRPDSGDPIEVLTTIIPMLDKGFGSTVNALGYKVLKNVRVLQGDGVNLNTIAAILKAVTDLGYSAENLVFGMGGALLQKVNRDTLKFAMKTSAIYVNGEGWRDVYKQPINEPFKKSRAGLQDTFIDATGAIVTDRYDINENRQTLLYVVYRSGSTYWDDDFDAIRTRANKGL